MKWSIRHAAKVHFACVCKYFYSGVYGTKHHLENNITNGGTLREEIEEDDADADEEGTNRHETPISVCIDSLVRWIVCLFCDQKPQRSDRNERKSGEIWWTQVGMWKIMCSFGITYTLQCVCIHANENEWTNTCRQSERRNRKLNKIFSNEWTRRKHRHTHTHTLNDMQFLLGKPDEQQPNRNANKKTKQNNRRITTIQQQKINDHWANSSGW